MKATLTFLALEVLASALHASQSPATAPIRVGCPVSIGSVAPSPLQLSLRGSEGLSQIEIARPSESGFFVAATEGAALGSAVLEFQVDSRRETSRVQLAELPGHLDWSTAVSSGTQLVGTISPGTYRLVLIYVSPEAPSSGKAQRLCMAMSDSFDVTETIAVHRFE